MTGRGKEGEEHGREKEEDKEHGETEREEVMEGEGKGESRIRRWMGEGDGRRG